MNMKNMCSYGRKNLTDWDGYESLNKKECNGDFVHRLIDRRCVDNIRMLVVDTIHDTKATLDCLWGWQRLSLCCIGMS